jgi:hypothetical protein
VVLGPAELGRHGQVDLGPVGLGQVVARDFAVAVRQRLGVRVSQREIQVGQAGLLGHLAARGVQLALARLDQPLGKIPVRVGAQHEKAHALRRAAEDYGARGALFELDQDALRDGS